MHVILKQSKVVINLSFMKVLIMSLELRGGTTVNLDIETEDGLFVIEAVESYYQK